MAHLPGVAPAVGGPPEPPAPVDPAGVVVPPAVAPPRTYRELFTDEAQSPPPGRVASYL